jgi:hypothetical protein
LLIGSAEESGIKWSPCSHLLQCTLFSRFDQVEHTSFDAWGSECGSGRVLRQANRCQRQCAPDASAENDSEAELQDQTIALQIAQRDQLDHAQPQPDSAKKAYQAIQNGVERCRRSVSNAKIGLPRHTDDDVHRAHQQGNQ